MSEVLKRRMRCAVYTRKSTDEGLDQEYNSIDAQRDAGHAYIASQRAEGWIPVADDYDDPAFSGGNMERPALQRMMADIEAGKIDVVVIYKIDRLTRSLAGLALALDGGLRPKNSGPDQRMPVISRAIIERLGYMRPWKSYWPSAVAITRYSTPLYSRTSTVPAAGR